MFIIVFGKSFQPSQMFVSKATAYPNEALQGRVLGFIALPAKDKHFILPRTFINYDHKKFIKLSSQWKSSLQELLSQNFFTHVSKVS
jgi:hypothetical protein